MPEHKEIPFVAHDTEMSERSEGILFDKSVAVLFIEIRF